MDTRQTVEAFDAYLEQRGLNFEGIVIGGAALNLLGVIARATKDCDVLDPEIPPSIVAAARAFAAVRRRSGEILQDDWFNNGPRSLTKDLPFGWRQRTQPLFDGKSLRLQIEPWLEERDANELWPAHVRATLADLARKLGHAV